MKNEEVDCDEAARAYEELIEAGDRARLRPDEIRGIAAALKGLPPGGSFSVTVTAMVSDAYTSRVVIEY